MKRIFLTYLLIAHSISIAAAAESELSLSDQIDGIFSSVDNVDTPGCAVGVIQDGKFVHKAGYGMANLELDVALSPDSVFRIASVSKQFTAAAVLLMADDGLIDLDDDIRKYLPDLIDYGVVVPIRSVLGHVSGIPDYELALVTGDDVEQGAADYGLRSSAGGPFRMGNEDYLSINEFYDVVKAMPLSHAPMTKFDYSNTNYFLLSMLVETVTGQSLREYAQVRIFEPLGMNETQFHDDVGDIIKNRATGYKQKEGGGYLTDMTNLYFVGDGGVHTSINDFLKWDQNFYTPMLGKDPAAFLELMNTPNSLILDDGAQYTNDQTSDTLYGNGQNIRRKDGHEIYSHSGGWLGYSTYYIRYQDLQLSVVALCNDYDQWPERLSKEVVELFLDPSSGTR